jgi:hypothetical protein
MGVDFPDFVLFYTTCGFSNEIRQSFFFNNFLMLINLVFREKKTHHCINLFRESLDNFNLGNIFYEL